MTLKFNRVLEVVEVHADFDREYLWYGSSNWQINEKWRYELFIHSMKSIWSLFN